MIYMKKKRLGARSDNDAVIDKENTEGFAKTLEQKPEGDGRTNTGESTQVG